MMGIKVAKRLLKNSPALIYENKIIFQTILSMPFLKISVDILREKVKIQKEFEPNSPNAKEQIDHCSQ